MGIKDIVTKDYTKESNVFADAFNQYIYNGRQIIKPENLKPLDTNLTGIPYGVNGSGIPTQRFRDVLKSVTAMEDGDRVYLLLAIEAQSEVHHAMPVRNMVYDALQYAAQVEDAANEGIQKERIEMAKRMLQEGGFSVEFIARIASLSVEEVQVLATESA